MGAPVTLFIVHRNQPERCLRTLDAFAHQGIDVSITILDNDSDPENLAMIRRSGISVCVRASGDSVGSQFLELATRPGPLWFTSNVRLVRSGDEVDAVLNDGVRVSASGGIGSSRDRGY
jgi:hypothetical protein